MGVKMENGNKSFVVHRPARPSPTALRESRPRGPALLWLAGALASAAQATILWEGREVAEWPDQHLTALGKGSAGSAPAPAGFYPSPK